MYKNLIGAALILALGAAPAAAQLNMGALQDAHNSINASRHLPTYLGDHFNTFQISVLNPYVSVGSNFASYQNAKDLLRADRLSSGLIGSTLNDLRTENNSVAGSLDLSIVNAACNIRDKRGRKILTLGAGVNERVEVSSSFNQELLQLAAYGNKQFANQTINILPRFNGMAFTEYYIAGSLSIINVLRKPAT